jgi:threonine dehydrogenase-like Zn-dependent dehydrogenase
MTNCADPSSADATMRAGRLDFKTNVFAVVDVPIPRPGTGDVRIRVKAAGVCLSDVHLIEGVLVPRRLRGHQVTLGHEVSGTIDELGPDVEGWSVRDRVAVYPIVEKLDGNHTLGVDYDGGWAQYVVTPATTLVKIPDTLPFEQAAIVPDAVSTPWGAIAETAQVNSGESVAVWGVGGLGAHAIQLLRFVGAAPIIAVDPITEARSRAVELGADHALDPAAGDFEPSVLDITNGKGVDVAFDFAGASIAQAQALTVLAQHGRLVLVGMSGKPLTINDTTTFSALGQRVLGHFGSRRHHLEELMRLIELGRLDLSGSISGTLALEDAAHAVERLRRKADNVIRLVLLPTIDG